MTCGRWFSLGTPVSSINKTNHQDITELLLKVVLNTIKHHTPNPENKNWQFNFKWTVNVHTFRIINIFTGMFLLQRRQVEITHGRKNKIITEINISNTCLLNVYNDWCLLMVNQFVCVTRGSVHGQEVWYLKVKDNKMDKTGKCCPIYIYRTSK